MVPHQPLLLLVGIRKLLQPIYVDLLDHEHLDYHTISKVMNLRFYDGDFVIVVLPVDRRGL